MNYSAMWGVMAACFFVALLASFRVTHPNTRAALCFCVLFFLAFTACAGFCALTWGTKFEPYERPAPTAVIAQ